MDDAPYFPVSKISREQRARLSVRESALRELLAWDIEKCNHDEEVPPPDDWSEAQDYVSAWVGAWLCERRAEILSELESESEAIRIRLELDTHGQSLHTGAFTQLKCTGIEASDWDLIVIKCEEKTFLTLVTMRVFARERSIRLAMSTGRTRELFQDRMIIQVKAVRANSLVSALRELDAIAAVRLLDPRVKDLILGQGASLRAQSTTVDESHNDDMKKKKKTEERLALYCGHGFAKHAAERCNASQLEAVAAVCGITQANRYEVALVKGPPGTGKTTTTAVALNAVHLRQFRRYYEAVRRAAEWEAARASHAETETNPEKWLIALRSIRPRLLVCAPTNVAIDNVVRKLVDEGFTGGDGVPYSPDVVRLGRGGDSKISASLDQRVSEVFDQDDDNLKKELAKYKRKVLIAGRAAAASRLRLWLFTYCAPKELPLNFEVRVWPFSLDNAIAGKTDEPYLYYVNHANQSTQREPPDLDSARVPLEECAPEMEYVVGQLHAHLEDWVRCSACVEARSTVLNLRNTRDTHTGRSPSVESIKRSLAAKILDSSEIVCATLHGAGHGSVLDARPFHAIVVDEAANCFESASLVALRLLKSRSDSESDSDSDEVIDLNETTLKSNWLPALALIGDPCQLPATRFANGCNWATISLFERLEKQGYPCYLLDTQYRMHPKISSFPSKQFYQARLHDGESAIGRSNEAAFAWREHFQCFHPFVFLNLHNSRELTTKTGRANPDEARLAANVCASFLKAHASANDDFKASRLLQVGVITFYRDQLSHIRTAISSQLKENGGYIEEIRDLPEINTVDAFQGREKDVVIISCVRADGQGVGFLKDVRRLNVAITRAKRACIIVGHADTLQTDRTWRNLLDYARSQQTFIDISRADTDLYSFHTGLRSALPEIRRRLLRATDRRPRVDPMPQLKATPKEEGEEVEDGKAMPPAERRRKLNDTSSYAPSRDMKRPPSSSSVSRMREAPHSFH